MIDQAAPYRKRLGPPPPSPLPRGGNSHFGCGFILYFLVFLSGAAFSLLGVYVWSGSLGTEQFGRSIHMIQMPRTASGQGSSSLEKTKTMANDRMDGLAVGSDRSGNIDGNAAKERDATLPQRGSSSSSSSSSSNLFAIPDWAFADDGVTRRSRCIRLLFMAAIYTENQFLSFQRVLDGLRDISNSDLFDVSVHLQVASGFNEEHPRYKEVRCIISLLVFV